MVFSSVKTDDFCKDFRGRQLTTITRERWRITDRFCVQWLVDGFEGWFNWLWFDLLSLFFRKLNDCFKIETLMFVYSKVNDWYCFLENE